jgi:hypothetical protein
VVVMASTWAIRPAVVGPGAADQPATDDHGTDQGQPERHHQPAPLGTPAQLAVLVGPGMSALDHPPAAHLDRRRHPTSGDLAHHAPSGQDLPARLVVIAGVQVHPGSLGQRDGSGEGVQGGRQQPVIAVVGRGSHRGQWDATSLDRDRALQALLAAIHRAGPGHLAPQGALVMHPSTASCSNSKPNSRS